MSKSTQKIACFGGIYSNHLALHAAIVDAQQRGADRLFCLGDFGGFGPNPNRSLELLRDNDIFCIQGNYDHSIGNELDDCQCGYTDPRDNYFAQISYDYTLRKTDPDHRAWMRRLPKAARIEFQGQNVLLSHGSPRKTNEFLWESTTSTHFLDHLADSYKADVLLTTHTGIKWKRQLSEQRLFANIGVLGRPENDGNTHVWYTILEGSDAGIRAEFIPIAYDHDRLAQEMRDEQLPEEFVETTQTGWWTTCLEVLPVKERRRGKY